MECYVDIAKYFLIWYVSKSENKLKCLSHKYQNKFKFVHGNYLNSYGIFKCD